jgi:hypothetical protein
VGIRFRCLLRTQAVVLDLGSVGAATAEGGGGVGARLSHVRVGLHSALPRPSPADAEAADPVPLLSLSTTEATLRLVSFETGDVHQGVGWP